MACLLKTFFLRVCCQSANIYEFTGAKKFIQQILSRHKDNAVRIVTSRKEPGNNFAKLAICKYYRFKLFRLIIIKLISLFLIIPELFVVS